MTQTPEVLTTGALVEFAFSVGEVQDIAISENRIMVLVKSPKGVWRNHPAEWLEYRPGAIQPADPAKAEREIELYRGYIEKMLVALDEMHAQWRDAIAEKAYKPLGESAGQDH